MGYKSHFQVSGLDCWYVSVEGSGLSSAHYAWSKVDQISAIPNHDCGRRTGTIGIGHRGSGTEEDHLCPCWLILRRQARWLLTRRPVA